MVSRHAGESSLRRWALGLVAVLVLLVGGTWATLNITTSHLLTEDATSNARDWAEFVAANVSDLEQIAAGEQPSAASMSFFDATRKSGQVFRYVVFNRDGYSQLVSDRQKIALVDLSEFNPDAARAVKSGLPFVAFKTADRPDVPKYYAEAFVPIRVGNQLIAVVAAYVDESEPRERFYNAFLAAAAALCLLTAVSFGVPAFAWYRRTQEKQRADRRIHYLAHHDALTGLLNRARLIERLERALDQNAGGRAIALHFIDIDRFKDVNDTLGHDGGDALLKTIAARLTSACRQDDLVARLGGDEFVVAQIGVGTKAQAKELAQRLWRDVAAPIEFRDQRIVTTLSIGVAVSPDDGRTSERLLKSADLALYAAKANGRNCVRFFTEDMDEAMQSRLKLERTIRDATEHEKFELAYQPIFALHDRDLIGFEALLRLRDSDNQPIPPVTFIPVAEELHLIAKIGAWVLRKACRTAATWPNGLKVAINLSAAQFDDGRIGETVATALRDSGLAPGQLELEITEGLLLANDERNMAQLQELKAIGAAVVMDDFGTGYSSLSYLWKFPFDKIKIDQSFMRSLGGDEEKVETVIKTIVALGRALHMPVTVEGVEFAEQLDFLEGVDAQEVQGFYLGRPMSPADAQLVILSDLGRLEKKRMAPSAKPTPLPLVS